MNIVKIRMHAHRENLNGFTSEKDYASWTDNCGVQYASSGVEKDGNILVFRLDGVDWREKWVDKNSVIEVTECILAYRWNMEKKIAVHKSEVLSFDGNLFVTDEDFRFRINPEDGCPECGEHTLYATYTPIDTGIYSVEIGYACGHDDYDDTKKSYKTLSITEHNELKAESDRIKAENPQN